MTNIIGAFFDKKKDDSEIGTSRSLLDKMGGVVKKRVGGGFQQISSQSNPMRKNNTSG